MTAAVLFRGHAHRPPHDPHTCRPWGVDWRKCLVSQYRHLLFPFRERFRGVEVFLCFYDTPHYPDVAASYMPVGVRLARPGAEQKETFLNGLGMILDRQTLGCYYDIVATCRFDLELKSCVADHPNFDPGKVNFLWREWKKEAWDSHRRVPDALHFLPGSLLSRFYDAVEETPSNICLHTVHDSVVKNVGAANVNLLIRDGYTNSNTDVDENPFYKMVRVQ